MNSQSDLTIDRLFTIVSANAFNDPPARSHLPQGAEETPEALRNPGGHSSCQQQPPHPLRAAQRRPVTTHILCLLAPPSTSPPRNSHPPRQGNRLSLLTLLRQLFPLIRGAFCLATFHCVPPLLILKGSPSEHLPPTQQCASGKCLTLGSPQSPDFVAFADGHAVNTPMWLILSKQGDNNEHRGGGWG